MAERTGDCHSRSGLKIFWVNAAGLLAGNSENAVSGQLPDRRRATALL